MRSAIDWACEIFWAAFGITGLSGQEHESRQMQSLGQAKLLNLSEYFSQIRCYSGSLLPEPWAETCSGGSHEPEPDASQRFPQNIPEILRRRCRRFRFSHRE